MHKKKVTVKLELLINLNILTIAKEKFYESDIKFETKNYKKYQKTNRFCLLKN